MRTKLNKLMPALLVSATLTACGGSDQTADTSATNTQETANGAVTGFGSVIVEGKRYDDDGTTVFNELDATSPTPVALTDLQLGMQVELVSDQDNAQTITIRAEVIGQIDGLTADGFTLAGQTVSVTGETVFNGASSHADLAVGDYVVVHGQRDENEVIVASRVGVKDPDATRVWRVAGTANSVDTENQSFNIGRLSIAWSDTTRIAPNAESIVDGVRVAVYGNSAPVAGVLQANAIRIRGTGDPTPIRIRVGGAIRDLDFAAKTFRIHRFRVDASEATYVDGTANNLANRRHVRVIGTVGLNDADQRIINANEVKFRGDFEGETELTGPISSYVDASSFIVRGVPVNASADTVQFTDGTVENLANGVIVRVKGSVDGNVLQAKTIDFVDTQLSQRRSVAGLVRNFDSSAGTFILFGISMQLLDNTIYEYGDGGDASIADLNDGDLVRVIGYAKDGIFQVAKLILRRGTTIVIDHIGGSAYNVDVRAGVFHINGTAIRFDDSTHFDGERVNLRNGARVVVSGTRVNGEFVAGSVQVIQPDGDSLLRVRGVITAIDSSIITVENQRVDITNAEIVGGDVPALMIGTIVDARGSMADGVLAAHKVTIDKD